MSGRESLYGVPRPKKKAKEISSSTSLAFTSQLSSLLSAEAGKPRSSAGRTRPSSSKSDIFTSHNRNAKKRAARDLEDDGQHGAATKQDIGSVDAALLHRSKRKMEEKARLYTAMKRGEYVPPGGDERRSLEELGLVDFDRKWAESNTEGQGTTEDASSDEDEDNDGSDQEMIEYTDEFGRQRQGTRADVAREERRKRVLAADEPDRFSARPAQPSNIIYGDTVQTAAFNPDESIAAKIEELAQKRDRSLTPPDDLHYDASAEIRSKGVGFYSFSKDKEGRKREMDQLERERVDTEQARRERDRRKELRKAELLERRQKIKQKKGAAEADRFLESLTGELEIPSTENDGDG
ncbi:MAG: hypothetical protein M1825_000843 [Sarcosagium campestre]|nr:MAG: hypothetical protein M1825_000843 [Sarcosagium campestre]